MPHDNQKQKREAQALAKKHGLKYTAALAVVKGEKTLEQQLSNPRAKK